MGGWGDKNVILIVSMPKTPVFTVFLPLCTTHCAKDVEQNTLSQASMPFATMPETLVFTVFGRLCTTYCARMWNKESCRKNQAFGGHAQTLVFTSFLFLYVLRAEDSALTRSISETETQCNKE